jgi:leucyl aminopeptidase
MKTGRHEDIAFRVGATSPLEWSGDGLALGLFQGTTASDLAALDERLGGALRALLDETEFVGEKERVVVTRASGASPIRWLVLVGLGPRDALALDDLRRAGAAMARTIKRQGPRAMRSVGIGLPAWGPDAGAGVQAAIEGFELAMHEGQWSILTYRFKAEPDPLERSVETVDFLSAEGQSGLVERASAVCHGILLSRELVAAPPNVIGPAELAETARSIAAEYGMAVEIWERDACERRGMGAFLGAARGSEAAPRLVHLVYRPAGQPRRKVAVVALGITFDPEGLTKDWRGRIDGMKRHKGAASSALGAALALGRLRPDVEAHFVLPLADKALGRGALRPGDLLTASNGRTIEVNGSDAEGRLMLADALIFAEQLGVDAILDMATLTTGCVQALGEEIAGLWASGEAIAAEVQAAADASGERVWRMPLFERYREQMRPPFADLRCTGPRDAEHITAALFLCRFVEKTPWAHLDIEGPSWSPRVDGYCNAGATGFGTSTLVRWLCG